MRTLLRISVSSTVLSAALAATLTGAGPAHAAPPECSFYSWGTTIQSGATWGGPAGPGDLLTCTIQTGANDTHAEQDADSASGVGAVPPTLVTYFVDPGDPVYLCTQRSTPGGPTLYWDATSRVYSTDPHVSCVLALSIETGGGTFYWVP